MKAETKGSRLQAGWPARALSLALAFSLLSAPAAWSADTVRPPSALAKEPSVDTQEMERYCLRLSPEKEVTCKSDQAFCDSSPEATKAKVPFFNAMSPDIGNQAKAHCAALRIANHTRDALKATRSVWQGTALVCGAVCLAPGGWLGNSPWQNACYGAAALSLVEEVRKAKKVENALKSLTQSITQVFSMVAGTAATLGQLGLKSSAKNAFKGKGQGQKNSCYTAAFAAVQTLGKTQSISQYETTSLTSAREVKNLVVGLAEASKLIQNGITQPYSNYGINSVSGSSAMQLNSAAGSGFRGVIAGSAGLSQSAALAEVCDSGVNGGNSTDLIRCATTADSGLLPEVKDPEFLRTFEKLAGTSLGDFTRRGLGADSGTLAKAWGAASGNSGSESILSQGLKDAQASLDADGGRSGLQNEGTALATYHSSGNGGGLGSSEAADPLAASLSGFLDQLQGGTGDAQRDPASVTTLDFARTQMSQRNPSAVVEDPRISLFDRVTVRYSNVSERLRSAP